MSLLVLSLAFCDPLKKNDNLNNPISEKRQKTTPESKTQHFRNYSDSVSEAKERQSRENDRVNQLDGLGETAMDSAESPLRRRSELAGLL